MIKFDKDQYAAGFKTYGEMGSPVPAGEYVAIITEIANEEARNKPGVYNLKTVFTIDEGKFEKRKVFSRFYYQNEFGLGRFLALAKVAGQTPTADNPGIDDRALIGKKVIIVIKDQTRKDTGEITPNYSYAKPFDPEAVSAEPDPDVPFKQ
jgi:hypothetical protein